MINKHTIGNMMQTFMIHSLNKQLPQLGMQAYWSVFANESSNDRTPEITTRVRGGEKIPRI